MLPGRFISVVLLLSVFCLNSMTLAQTSSHQNGENSELIRRIQKGTDPQALLQAGSSGNTKFVPLLRERLRHDADKNNSLTPQARMALAKLGDKQEQQALFCRVASGNMNEMQVGLSHELPYVGGWFSIQILDRVIRSELATNPRPVPLPPDLSFAPAQVYAREVAHKMFTDIPVQSGPAIPSVQQWNEYFNTHKTELSKLQPTGEGVKFSPDACKGGKVRKK